jgi:protein-tyrosine-phosphatase
MPKLKQTIQLSKSTGLGSKHMFDISYEVNYVEGSKQATLIPDSIQIHDHVARRIIRDHDILQSEFLTTLCREDAKTVNWWELVAAQKFHAERLLDIHKHAEDYEDPAYDEIQYEQRQASF